MKISLIEPLNVPKATIDRLSAGLTDKGHVFEYYSDKTTDENELLERSRDSDIVMIANNPMPGSVISKCENLKMLDVAFTGVDHVGLDIIKEKNIVLCNAAGYSDISVSELAVGLVLDLYRNISAGDKAIRCGGTLGGNSLMGTEISGKTVGIVGTGRIGTMTARLFLAFGAKVIAYSRTERADVKAMGVEYVSLDSLMKEADIVSLHVPNIPETRGLIGDEKLRMMKSSAILVNCARGPIVDNAALADVLNEGVIAGAGIDVFDMEPPIPEDYELLGARNAILTPHVAYATHESMERRAEIAFDNVYRYLEGNPVNVVEV
ncbi:D-3-phosphoglycerate dehydrogenase [Dethiosulfatibacter aminovorans DSM 17477]|uniref:D-3-phosphoglycerate dehydrogenase n=1 Tax=Dethiosulfatibacter aminovorans DSM 17477 TaxID=1121476 RepID=A0A1M6JVZ7_9FIRM|nr:2-hydroxyacid dehydrogenase [Dethiosulfatibacter aminovorans]SHJ50881.1 D-3-phosphoglycerate dehydrogenase [Dethiosulfatibacter aminovorans DSM 17477]